MALITEVLRSLAPLAAKPLADYLASPTDEVLAEQSFTALADLGILDREFATRIAACAGLRNRWVINQGTTPHGSRTTWLGAGPPEAGAPS